MPQMRFTAPFVQNVKPPSKEEGQVQYFENRDRGLTLVLSISYGGTKTWRALFYVGGKPRSRRLGKYPAMSLDAARKAASKFDPGKAVASTEAGTFKQIAEDWIVEYVDAKGLRSKKELVRHLNTYVYPVWGERLLFNIKRKDVTDLLKELAEASGKNQADAVLHTIRGVMTWYAVQDGEYNSPIVPKMKRDQRSSAERARNRTLNHDEIRAVWKASDELDTYGALVKMLLLTGQRLRKVAHMQWADIEGDIWTIRTDKREKSNAGSLKLPKPALEILKLLPRIDGNPHVFPAAVGKGPINSFSQRKEELDARLPKQMPDWRIHDLRRTARTLMAEAGVADHIAERTLGHTIPGVAGTYNRFDYPHEKADALKRLAGLIATILNPPQGKNIVSLPRKTAS